MYGTTGTTSENARVGHYVEHYLVLTNAVACLFPGSIKRVGKKGIVMSF